MEKKEIPSYVIWIICGAVLGLVVLMYSGLQLEFLKIKAFDHLPLAIAIINGLTAITLITAVYFIKQKNIAKHKQFINLSIRLSVIFLVCYVLYHITHAPTKFGDTDYNGVVSDAEKLAVGSIRYFYYFILFTHIVLAATVLPFVLFTYARALKLEFDRHKKLARITFPIWLYVTITGVIAYILINPYYNCN